MITLCTDNPQYRIDADQVFISLPSGPDEPVAIALTRNQLCQLRRTVMIAMDASFDQPEASTAEIVSMPAKVVG
jgi:hypothetical protein